MFRASTAGVEWNVVLGVSSLSSPLKEISPGLSKTFSCIIFLGHEMISLLCQSNIDSVLLPTVGAFMFRSIATCKFFLLAPHSHIITWIKVDGVLLIFTEFICFGEILKLDNCPPRLLSLFDHNWICMLFISSNMTQLGTLWALTLPVRNE